MFTDNRNTIDIPEENKDHESMMSEVRGKRPQFGRLNLRVFRTSESNMEECSLNSIFGPRDNRSLRLTIKNDFIITKIINNQEKRKMDTNDINSFLKKKNVRRRLSFSNKKEVINCR